MTGPRRVDVVLPQLGETVARGTVLRWLVEPGDRVDEDEHICEISTDKIDTEIPSPAAGVVDEIVVEAGTTVEVGTVLARLAAEEDAVEPSGPAARTPEGPTDGVDARGERSAGADERSDAGASATEDEPLHFAESGIDLFGGGGGDTPAGKPPAEERVGPAGEPPVDEAGALVARDGASERASAIRQVMAERTARSKREIPHCTTVMEADLAPVARLRDRRGEAFEEATGVRLTYLPFLARSTTLALGEHSRLNAAYEGGALQSHETVHLGLAVATDDGLLVPVVRRAGRHPLPELVRHMDDLASRARSGALDPEEVQGGTFTLTNHGRGGSLWGTPVIIPPQTGILGVGRIRDVPVVRKGDVEIGTRCYLSLSFDHRAVDGAAADAFLRTVIGRLTDETVIAEWVEEAL